MNAFGRTDNPLPLRVLIFNDSPTMRDALKAALRPFADIVVVAEADSGQNAAELVRNVAPNVVLMDVIMPGKDGYEATREIMELAPTPIVMISSVVDPRDSKVVFEALSAGALCIAEAPPPPTDPRYRNRTAALAQLVRSMAAANVHREFRPEPALPAGVSAETMQQKVDAIGIVASTGGPSALVLLLTAMPQTCPPVLIVQHLAHGFAGSFADWLTERTGHPAKVASDGEYAMAGRVYLAPDDCHLELSERRTIHVHRAPPVGLFRPSGNLLLSSLARALGPRALGVVLTGMGDDGAAGALQLRQAGGHVVVQDEATSVVYGMPRAALAGGAAELALPLPQIAGWLKQKCGLR